MVSAVDVCNQQSYSTNYGYTSHVWLTWNKYQELRKVDKNIRMKEGAKGMPLIFWSIRRVVDEKGLPVLDDNGEGITYPLFKSYTVFNADCFEGLHLKEENGLILSEKEGLSADEKMDDLLSTYEGHPSIFKDSHEGAYYRPSDHSLHVPMTRAYFSEAEAFSTFSHELTHSTGKALGRNMKGGFGSQSYSYEELVAECGAAILCAKYGYLQNTVEQSASYLDGWAKALRDNQDWIYRAMRDAEKAVALILGEKKESSEKEVAA